MDEDPIPQHPRPTYTLTTIFIVAAGLLIALALTAFAFIVGNFGKTTQQEDSAVKSSPLVESSSVLSATDEQLTGNGVISGSLSYPAEMIPTDMKVCAVNQTTQAETCTSDHLQSEEEPHGLSYKLEVPAGTYLVYAQLPGQPQKAYYSEFVTCGLSAECPSHAPIPVEVKAGDTVSNVDPHDWYASP